MECKNCGAQWALRSGMPQPRACPFCGAALAAEPPRPAAALRPAVPGSAGGADEDDWFEETAPPPGLAMDDAAWERYLRDTSPAVPKAPVPQPASAKPASSRPETRTFEGRPQIRCLMEYTEYGRTLPVTQDPRYQFALWPSQTVIRIDRLENGMELICGVKPEREDTLYRIDAVDRAADGSVAVSMTNLADGSTAKQSFRPNDRFLELAQEERKWEYLYYDDEKGQHALMDPVTYATCTLFPAELGKALPYIEAAETVHDITRCTLDGKQTDLWAEVTLKVLSTMAVPNGREQLAAAKNGLQFRVPDSIVPGDLIRVDTRTGAFLRKTEPEELPHGRDAENGEFRAAPADEGEAGYEIVEYTGRGKRQVVVPALIDGQPITKVGMGIFGGSEVESVIVSEGIQKISTNTVYALPASASDEKDRRFLDRHTCGKLTRVSLPGSVTAIDAGAFDGCTALQGIILPQSVTEVGDFAFCGCSSIEIVIVQDPQLELDGYQTFKGCPNVRIQRM